MYLNPLSNVWDNRFGNYKSYFALIGATYGVHSERVNDLKMFFWYHSIYVD